MSAKPLKAGILGATGTVGQRFINLLSTNPTFEIAVLGASERSAGKKYNDATNWKLADRMPENVKALTVCVCDPAHFSSCDVVFSGLDANIAGEIEKSFIEAEFPVFSNAKNFRMYDRVPLVIPLVNPEHLAVVSEQQKEFNLKKGFIVTNSNCAVTGVAVALKALQLKFGDISHVLATTMQAISGAGYPGVPSLDIMDNVVPFIGGEEPKFEAELMKLLGTVNQTCTGFDSKSNMKVSASCNRVPVVDGHLASVSIKFASANPPSVDQVVECLQNYKSESQILGCYSAPEIAIDVRMESDRPQPRLDRMNGNGMSVTVGRVRECSVFDIKFSVLAHNTIIGAAGASILNAEVAYKMGLVFPK
ncbi:hypothetical protein BB560_000834 [Smittium megazygosporum]|uniref:Aspartate-semialdehyde dehydrogenase n=1 Tax=Smittium megazygosporum TaxID=133381 RepID=A0A2T9ZJ81_9FUNG|nr:hypothetical protein BB560_000834 [Smittium megazygosporum]